MSFALKRPLFLLVLALLLVACGPTQPDATTTPAPTAEALPTVAPPTTVPDPDLTDPSDTSVWERVQTSGILTVGTAADYPPFEYYDDSFSLTGYDIALMTALTQELGLALMFRDMAFDGLPEAMALGQVDAAVSALSVTAERAHFVDFSNIYYVGEDAVVASAESDVNVTTLADLADLRVGVQANSVYEQYVREALIEPGLMPEANLLAYGDSSQGVDDLETGRVDVVMVDLAPAEAAVEALGNLKIVAQGLHRQRFAIALPKDEPEMLAAFNEALETLQSNGRVAELAEEYLGLEDAPPIVEPPDVTPDPPEESCIDGMAAVGDLTFDDENMSNPPVVSPNQTFQKGWRVRNVGTCTWDSGYALAYVSGNVPSAQMGGSRVFVEGDVAPGETYDFVATLRAPSLPGTYQAFWEMEDPDGQGFGERVWVGVTVIGAPTPVPIPTQTAVPSINFTVDANPIEAGDCATFSWNVQNVEAVWFYPNGQDYNQYPVEPVDSSSQCPATTTTYILRVAMPSGQVEMRQLRLVVTPAEDSPPPRITAFPAQPETIVLGQCVMVSWMVEGNVDSVTLLRNGAAIWNGAPLSAEMQDCPPSIGYTGYVLEAAGPGGRVRLQANVNVVP